AANTCHVDGKYICAFWFDGQLYIMIRDPTSKPSITERMTSIPAQFRDSPNNAFNEEIGGGFSNYGCCHRITGSILNSSLSNTKNKLGPPRGRNAPRFSVQMSLLRSHEKAA
ncbi:MAG: hypothetical protein R6X33_13115, partial [Candidatus Brocadiia bacterium]